MKILAKLHDLNVSSAKIAKTRWYKGKQASQQSSVAGKLVRNLFDAAKV
jgi:hypothetical protein